MNDTECTMNCISISSAMLKVFSLNFWFAGMLIYVKASIIYVEDSEDQYHVYRDSFNSHTSIVIGI